MTDRWGVRREVQLLRLSGRHETIAFPVTAEKPRDSLDCARIPYSNNATVEDDETSMITPLTKPSVHIDDHASATRGSLRRERDFCAACTVRRNPKAAKITARVSSRGLPRSDSVRYSVSRESPVLSASAAIPPTASTTVRSATGTARASPSSSMASMYAATSASLRR
jgi:hypothetical protein